MNPSQGPLILRRPLVVAAVVIGSIGITPFVEAATPLDLPPSVSPGAVIPNLDRDSWLPRDQGPEVPAPAEQKAPPVPESGVRIAVKAFVITGVIDHPERGITLDELERTAEAIRNDHPRGFTISELQKVTDELTRIYRSAGYILARAYIPEQEVADGRVIIEILEGKLERLSLEGNKKYSEKLLTRPFEDIINNPINREEVERALLELSDYPGLQFNSVFSPGDTLGTAKLGLNIESEKSLEGTVWFDNFGSELTGEYRLWANASYNNPTGAADRLSAQILTSLVDNPEDGKSNFYALGYQRPIFGPSNLLSVDFSGNTYSVGGDFTELGLEGESNIFSTSLRRNFVRSRKKNIQGHVALASKSSSSGISSLTIGKDALTVLTLGSVVDYRDGWAGYTQAGLDLSVGLPGMLGAMDEDGDGQSSRTSASGAKAGGDFSKINVNLTRVQPLLFSPALKNSSLLARVQFQSSSDLLVSLEQMSLGGPNSVRAYPPAEFMVDTGYFVSLELVAKSSSTVQGIFLENLQLSAFYDYAAGELNDPLANDVASPMIQGIGLSAQFSPRKNTLARLELASPIGDPSPSNDRSTQYFFKLGYMF